jgi:hypothetical protein
LISDLADSVVVVVLLLLLAVAPLPEDPMEEGMTGAGEVGHNGWQLQPACTQSLKTTHTFFKNLHEIKYIKKLCGRVGFP